MELALARHKPGAGEREIKYISPWPRLTQTLLYAPGNRQAYALATNEYRAMDTRSAGTNRAPGLIHLHRSWNPSDPSLAAGAAADQPLMAAPPATRATPNRSIPEGRLNRFFAGSRWERWHEWGRSRSPWQRIRSQGRPAEPGSGAGIDDKNHKYTQWIPNDLKFLPDNACAHYLIRSARLLLLGLLIDAQKSMASQKVTNQLKTLSTAFFRVKLHTKDVLMLDQG